MKEATINNHINKNPLFNCTHVQAWIIGKALTTWNWYNLLYWIKPLDLLSVSIVPINPDLEPEEFTKEMFLPNGIFYEQPLNHYLRIRLGKDSFLANAGYILNHFMISPKVGYKLIKEILNEAKKEFAINPTAEGTIVGFSGKGSSEQGGGIGLPYRNGN